jgi:hypothetical protein
MTLEDELIKRGQKSIVDITGFPEDVKYVTSAERALQVIDHALELGIERNNELNELRMRCKCDVK